MLIVVPEYRERPEECLTCKAQTPPKVGYCAPRRCYCRHAECPAFATTPELQGDHVPEPVEVVSLEEARHAGARRHTEAAEAVASIKADLASRRRAREAGSRG